jgi:hypothetical protein
LSKPQIIGNAAEGYHNADVAKSYSRVMKGGSWKKQRIVVLVPSSDLIAARVYLSHCNLIYPPNQAVVRLLCLGQEVGDAYSNGIEQILASPELSTWEYVLTIESDNMPPPDGVIRLLEDMEQYPHLSCIGGLYWCKGEGGCAHIWGDPNDPVMNFRPQAPIPDTVQECNGSSMGFHLWRMSMFKDERLARPWFRTRADLDGVGTQDLTFWSDAKKYGYRTAVDTRIKVGHYDYEGKFGIPDFVW